MVPSVFLLSSFFLLSYFFPSVYSSFTYEFSVPGSCDDLEVSWTGGQGPFELILVPVFGTPKTYQIPDSAVHDGKGIYDVQVDFPVNQSIFLVMSDATGFGSGGTSLITQVGPSLSGNSCNTTDPGVDFFFSLNSALTQCRTYAFSGYDDAIQPVTIAGFIPGGNTFNLTPPTGRSSYNWKADLEAGTSVVFVMTDSQGRNGGASDVKLVGASGNSDCLDPTYPTSTSNPPTPTSSSISPSPSSARDDEKNRGPNTVVIVLASLGGVLALALTATLIFCLQRRRRREIAFSEGLYPHPVKHSGRMSLDLEEPRPIDNVRDDQNVSYITPFPGSQAASSLDPSRHSRGNLLDLGIVPSRFGPSPLNGPSKASQTGSLRQLRYIVHTDVEDPTPEGSNQDFVELPPSYSERRGQMPPSITGPSS